MTDCDKCKEYDKEKNYCPVFCNVINDTLTDRAVEELEKMWEKIRALPDINPDYPMDKTIHISRYEVQEIVYKRISELKGENNDIIRNTK